MDWKTAAKKLRKQRDSLTRDLQACQRRAALWEGLAKERPNAKAQQDADLARVDAFTGWFSARLLKTALEDALARGSFNVSDRERLERELGKVRFEDPEAYRC